MVSSGRELSPELSIFHSLSLELPIAPYFPEVGAVAMGSAACLALVLVCLKAKPCAGKAPIPMTQPCSRSQKGDGSSQSSRNHDNSPLAARRHVS